MQKRRSYAEWKELINTQKASGQGIKQWCNKNKRTRGLFRYIS